MIVMVLVIAEGEGGNGRVNCNIEIEREAATPREEVVVNQFADACRRIAAEGKGNYAEERQS